VSIICISAVWESSMKWWLEIISKSNESDEIPTNSTYSGAYFWQIKIDSKWNKSLICYLLIWNTILALSKFVNQIQILIELECFLLEISQDNLQMCHFEWNSDSKFKMNCCLFISNISTISTWNETQNSKIAYRFCTNNVLFFN